MFLPIIVSIEGVHTEVHRIVGVDLNVPESLYIDCSILLIETSIRESGDEVQQGVDFLHLRFPCFGLGFSIRDKTNTGRGG